MNLGLARTLLPLLAVSTTLAPDARGGGAPTTQPGTPLQGWLLDEGAGTVTLDPFSFRNGTLEGFASAPWPAPGPFGYSGDHCLGFDGTDARVVTSAGGVVAGRAAHAISAWFRVGSALAPRQHVIYSERDTCEFNVLWVGIEKRPGVPNGLTFGIYDSTSPACGSGSWHTLTHPAVPVDVAWHHLVATLDPVGGMSLYFDGLLVGSISGVPPYRGGAQGTSTIGHAHTAATPTYFAGSIDEVGLFDYALSPAEVLWLHQNSLSGVPAPVHDTLCHGDGSGTACPCGNESAPGSGSGCEHSGGVGARLVARGSARTSFDTFSLTATEMTPNTSCLFFQGTTAVGGGAGAAFGDGLRCAGGSVLRLAVSVATDHWDYYPHPGDQPVSVKGALPAAGGERYYQVWFRNAPDYCTSAPFNLTNAVRAVWGP